ncbi:MAG: gamma-glutamylcyclotransferase family protein [Thermostichus sp. HHBFW_bins_43]
MDQQSTTESTTVVFVYGSLLRGGQYHSLMQGAEFLGTDSLNHIDLYDLGPYPMAIRGQNRLYGECYRIPLTLLSRLDELEEHPRVYERQWLCLDSGTFAWVYLGRAEQVQGCRLIPGGRWFP